MAKKYRRYKNGLEMYLSSKKGRRVLNFAYSWGAAVVILGALFKLLHFPFGNEMLFIGMITEFFVFFISGFEQPEEHYQWEQVFPELDSKNPMDKQEMEARRQYLLRKAQEAATAPAPSYAYPEGEHHESTRAYAAQPQAQPQAQASYAAPEGSYGASASEVQVERLSSAIDQLANAASQLSRLGELSQQMTDQWVAMQQDGRTLGESAVEYQTQMDTTSQHLARLNQIYESQLASITGQVATIDQINQGLEHIKNMYQDSAIDSTTFRTQNERLTMQLSELNRVYARILEALTVNMGAPGMAGRPYQGGYEPSYYAPRQEYPSARPDYYASQPYQAPRNAGTPQEPQE